MGRIQKGLGAWKIQWSRIPAPPGFAYVNWRNP